MYGIPSFAMKIGNSMKSAKILEGRGIENSDEVLQKKPIAFHQLCELNWLEQVSTHALRTLNEWKQNKVKMLPLTEVKMLPLTEDIEILSNYLKRECRITALPRILAQ